MKLPFVLTYIWLLWANKMAQLIEDQEFTTWTLGDRLQPGHNAVQGSLSKQWRVNGELLSLCGVRSTPAGTIVRALRYRSSVLIVHCACLNLCVWVRPIPTTHSAASRVLLVTKQYK